MRPPTHTGNRACTGFTVNSTFESWKYRPSCDAGPPCHSFSTISSASSDRAPRSPSAMLYAAKSAGRSPPTPTPRMNRPPLIRSIVAAPRAIDTGCHSGSSSTDVPSVTRLGQAGHQAENGKGVHAPANVVHPDAVQPQRFRLAAERLDGLRLLQGLEAQAR